MKKLLLALCASTLLYANVGKIVSLRGDAVVVRAGQEFKARSNDVLNESDVVKTSKNARLQVRFSDDTIVTLGKNSVLNVNKYVINGKQSAVDLAVDSGSYKVISGKISKLARDKFSFKANTATIGIRGTVFVGELASTPKGTDKVGCLEGAIDVKVGNKMSRINAGRQMSYAEHKVLKVEKLVAKDFEVTQALKVEAAPAAGAPATASAAGAAGAAGATAATGAAGAASATATGAATTAASAATPTPAATGSAKKEPAAKIDAAISAAAASKAQMIEAKKERIEAKKAAAAAKYEKKQEAIEAKKAAYGGKKFHEKSEAAKDRKEYYKEHGKKPSAEDLEKKKAYGKDKGVIKDSSGKVVSKHEFEKKPVKGEHKQPGKADKQPGKTEHNPGYQGGKKPTSVDVGEKFNKANAEIKKAQKAAEAERKAAEELKKGKITQKQYDKALKNARKAAEDAAEAAREATEKAQKAGMNKTPPLQMLPVLPAAKSQAD